MGDWILNRGLLMKVEEFERLVDYVAELRSKLQHARGRHQVMLQSMQLLVDTEADMVELSSWRDVIDDHEHLMENLRTQLSEYERLLGWPLTTEAL